MQTKFFFKLQIKNWTTLVTVYF